MELRKANRKKAKIRLGLSAVAGGGKTYSAILIALGLTGGDATKIAVIDTENSSSDLYAHLGAFNVLPLEAPYTPERYIEAIRTCEKAQMEVIIIDSTTHEWDGKGGCLELVEKLGGKYQDWAKVTPRHQAFVEAILFSTAHVITTVRRKQDYQMSKDGNGRTVVEKAGLKEIQRDGFEYELTINLELDMQHNARASKDRTGLFMGKPEFTPSVETGKLIAQWCEQGDAQDILTASVRIAEAIEAAPGIKALTEVYQKNKVDVDVNPRLQQLIAARRTAINAAAKEEPKANPNAPAASATEPSASAPKAEESKAEEPQVVTPEVVDDGLTEEQRRGLELIKAFDEQLRAATTAKAVTELYNNHKALVDGSEELKSMFKKRQSELKNVRKPAGNPA